MINDLIKKKILINNIDTFVMLLFSIHRNNKIIRKKIIKLDCYKSKIILFDPIIKEISKPFKNKYILSNIIMSISSKTNQNYTKNISKKSNSNI
jgi:hypothetical protein